jgi:hypothetical protein
MCHKHENNQDYKIFLNKNLSKGMFSFKSRSWNKKNKNNNTTSANKNPIIFYCKKETKQCYDKKTYPKLMLNRLKVMKISTYIYTHWAPNLHVAHVHPCVNYEWI